MKQNNKKKNMFDDSSEEMVKQIKKLREVDCFDWANASQHQDGVAINAELILPLNSSKTQKAPSLEMLTVKSQNAVAFSTHISGGRTCFLDQNIAALSKSTTRPNLYIVDSDRDLYIRHAKSLKQNGYDVYLLDFNDAKNSDRWNPYAPLIWRIKLIRELETELENKDGKYYGIGEMFTTYKDVRARIKELKSELYDFICIITEVLYNTDMKFDEDIIAKAKQIISAFTLAMCEDCISSKLGTAQLVGINLLSNFTLYSKGEASDMMTYLTEKRDRHSRVKHIVKDILTPLSADDKEEVFMIAERLIKTNIPYELGVLTSEDIIELYKESENPKAVFIIQPEQGSFMNGYTSLFLSQAYSCNTEMDEAASRQILYTKPDFVRPNYFIVNGYQNLPDIEFNSSIFELDDAEHKLILVSKSYRQLLAKYGDSFADWMKHNCMVKLFLSVDDMESRNEYRELCCVGERSEPEDDYVQSFKEMELFDKVRGVGNAVVSVFMKPPFITRFTSSETLTNVYYPAGEIESMEAEGLYLDKRVGFDIARYLHPEE